MSVDLTDILNTLEKLLPILGNTTGHPELAALASGLIDIAEEEIARRQSLAPGRTRSEILADAAAAYAEAHEENEKLKKLGHEDE